MLTNIVSRLTQHVLFSTSVIFFPNVRLIIPFAGQHSFELVLSITVSLTDFLILLLSVFNYRYAAIPSQRRHHYPRLPFWFVASGLHATRNTVLKYHQLIELWPPFTRDKTVAL